MVDTENHLYPLTPLEEDDIGSPLSGEFLQDMENIQDISQSLGDDSSGALSLTEFQSLGNGPGSDGSVITGKRGYHKTFFYKYKVIEMKAILM